jgi:hypothetical protein
MLVFPTIGKSADVQKGNEFEATVTFKSFGVYKVDLSPIPNLHWITTPACVEILILDDVVIEPYLSNGKVVGGFFYVIDHDASRDDWEYCQISEFLSYRPEE